MSQMAPSRFSSATVTSVNDLNTVQTLKAANASRVALYVYNDSDQALYIKLGSTATTSDFSVKVAAGGFYELPNNPVIYSGIVTGIWAADSTGAAKITEIA